ncbi:hypothetical protein KP509_03G083800 [Ceratopteris richardii]|uniref:MLO-like protein n=1 Tax=Ceratopteris richardii TaxID=49495 RepID=A0A8T2V8M2_CERRI|nr:hypothetical protein KP509_03G083800 [Ceratopteris richardii]
MTKERDTSLALLGAPTWGIAMVCAIFIIVSLVVERVIDEIRRSLYTSRNHGALLRAFEKMKNELFMVGILSITLLMGESLFPKLCLPRKIYAAAPLCKHPLEDAAITIEEEPSACQAGYISFMTTENIHDLHIFVFILAAVHIVFSVMVIVIGTLEVHRWQAWEAPAAQKPENEVQIAEGGTRINHQITFVQKHASRNKCSSNTVVSFMIAFVWQSFRWRMTESDYRALRSGFIRHHCPANPSFNFHKYIWRSFEDDCKRVVGVSWKLWVYAVLWLLIDVTGWETRLAVSFAPLLFFLVVGAAMQQVLTKMANKIRDQHVLVIGTPAVMPDDNLFWHGRPQTIIRCIHFIIFQNALSTAYAIWASVTFPSYNCLYGTPATLGIRVAIGFSIQIYCGFLTLPVYAFVSQMGSRLKKSIFSEEVNLALREWRKRAKKHVGKAKDNLGKNGARDIAVPLELSNWRPFSVS